MTGGEAREAAVDWARVHEKCYRLLDSIRADDIESVHWEFATELLRELHAAPSRAALETLAADFEAAANKRRCTVEHFGDRHERPVVAFTEGEAGAWAEAAEQLRALLADETGDQR